MTAWRYYARRAVTGEWLDLDLPLSRDELTWRLSGPGVLRASVSPDVGQLRAEDGRLLLEEWGTLVYAEADGELRWGGIVVSSTFEGARWALEIVGFSTYPNGIPFDAELVVSGADPATVVRSIWQRVQSHPDGNLGVEVVGSTSATVGTDAEPYELLWFNYPDSGREISTLAAEAPFDFIEDVSWNGDVPRHRILIANRRGRRRDDLAFVHGDNVVSVDAPTVRGDDFANEVIGIGAGEGREAVRRVAPVRDGRLRRVSVYSAKDVTSEARLDSLIATELRARSAALEISSVVVRDHPNAPIGAWELGDDVLVDAELPWVGRVTVWCRVVGWSLLSDTTASLELVRSDSFRPNG